MLKVKLHFILHSTFLPASKHKSISNPYSMWRVVTTIAKVCTHSIRHPISNINVLSSLFAKLFAKVTVSMISQVLSPRSIPPSHPGPDPDLVSPETLPSLWAWGRGQQDVKSLLLVKAAKWPEPEPRLHPEPGRHLAPLLRPQPRHLGALHHRQLCIPSRQGTVHWILASDWKSIHLCRSNCDFKKWLFDDMVKSEVYENALLKSINQCGACLFHIF